MRALLEQRAPLSMALGLICGGVAFVDLPFPTGNAFLQMVALERPGIFWAVCWAYQLMLFSTPVLAWSVLFSGAYIFTFGPATTRTSGSLPPYPNPPSREELYLVLGEVHNPKRREPVSSPQWLAIPERGMYTGIAVFGAIGSGKTSCCMYPYAEQILAYRASDKEKRAGALVLEVKGDFCFKVREMLRKLGREDDFIEVSIGSGFRYNPLHSDLDAYALAYGIASLLNNLFGKGKEPFWQQAYTNLVKFIILLHKTLDGYVTLFDVYECAINPTLLQARIRRGEEAFATQSILVPVDMVLAHQELDAFKWVPEEKTECMRAVCTEELAALLADLKIAFELLTRSGGDGSEKDAVRRAQFEAVKRWFEHDWMRIEPKLRTSIVEGISVFLSLFDDNPAVKYTFCPPREVYDPEANKDFRYGRALPSFSELVESGRVVALNFPVAANPGLARTIGTLLKQDFQRAMIGRIPQMERDKNRYFRPVLFLCDEYQSFATCGESDPTGDEKFFALSRQAKCIAIVATQSISSLRSTLSGESWRTLLQTFRTKIFLALSDDFSARTASDLCGKEEQFKLNYTLSESGQDAKVSMLTGRAAAHRSSVSASKSYSLQRDFIFEPKVFGELKNAQSIVLAYDGVNPLPPTFCYLKPYFRDRNMNYFEQLERKLI